LWAVRRGVGGGDLLGRQQLWVVSSVLWAAGSEVKKTFGRWRNWESRSGENPGKWTNEPERGEMGSMCNGLCEFGLGQELVVDRGLTRCSLKMQQGITDSSVVRGQLSVAGRGKETSGRGHGGVGGPRRTTRGVRGRRPTVASTAATVRVPETRAERGVVSGRQGAAIEDRVVMRADWSRKVRIGGVLLAT
jgi:hypothetical protein